MRQRVIPLFKAIAIVAAVLGLNAEGAFSSQAIPEFVMKVKPSIAVILANGDAHVSGSGLVVDSNGLLITALHVVEDAARLSVQFPGGQPQSAEVLQIDAVHDLALLRIEQIGLSAVGLGESSLVKEGDEVIGVGYLGAQGNKDVTVARGTIRGQPNPSGLVQVDALIDISGGPVLNLQGEVTGIVVLDFDNRRRLGLAPNTAIKALLSKHRDAGTMQLPLPLTTVQEIELAFQGAIGSGGPQHHSVRLAAACIQPPRNSRALIKVEGKLDKSAQLTIRTWLSLAGDFTLADDRVSIASTDLDLLPERVCLNYEGWSRLPLLPLGQSFKVRYILSYKVVKVNATP